MPHPTLGYLSRDDQLKRAQFLREEFTRLAPTATKDQLVLLRKMADSVKLDADIYRPLDIYLKEHGA